MKRTTRDPPPPSSNDSSPPPTPTGPVKELPDWFELRPFQYNGRVLITALPGICLALALSGELLLGVAVIGGLLIHFLQSGGAKRRAVMAYICVFIAAQMTVIYSALPLLWESLYNMIPILLLNMSMVMAGGWTLLHFEEFIKEEPALAEVIEMALFTIYPSVSVAITCCMLTMLTSPLYIPYCIIIHGFLILRLFVTPTQPSFRKQNNGSLSDSGAFVLGHAEVSLLLILYISAPAEVFIIMNVWNLFEFVTALKLLVLFCSPCFLMTLLELRTWTEDFGIAYKYVIMLRWTSGIASLLLGSILMKYTQVSFTVDWMSVTILANVLLGWTASKKRHIQEMFMFVCGLAVALIYTLAVYYSIPWHLRLHDMDLNWLACVLITDAVLSVACFLVCNSQNKKFSSVLLIVFMAGLVYTESFLFQHHLYSALLLLCTSVCSVYLLVRLLSAGTVFWYCAWIGSALHAFKVPFFVEVVAGVGHAPLGGSVSVVALTLTVAKLYGFERRDEISIRTASGYIVSIVVSVLLCYQSLLQRVWYMFHDSDPTLLQAICIINVLSATLILKLTTQHLPRVRVARRINIFWIIAVGLICLIQPSSSLTQHNLSMWLILIAGTLGVAVSFGIASPHHRPFWVFLLSVVFGFASGMKTSLLLFSHASRLTILQYSLSCIACSFILLNILTNYESKRPLRKQFFLKPSLCFLASVVLVTYITEASQVTDDTLSKAFQPPCLRLYCVINILLVFALRAHCLFLQIRDPFGSSPDQEALICNFLTISAYLLACFNCPLEQWEIWNSVWALLLLNLQRDPSVFTLLRTRSRTGVVFGACLINMYAATVMQSDLWNVGVGLVSLLELGLLVATFPVLSTFVLHQLVDNHNLNVELLVFMTPLNVLFFLLGSSYTSWLLAGSGLSAGFWMIAMKFSSKEGS